MMMLIIPTRMEVVVVRLSMIEVLIVASEVEMDAEPMEIMAGNLMKLEDLEYKVVDSTCLK